MRVRLDVDWLGSPVALGLGVWVLVALAAVAVAVQVVATVVRLAREGRPDPRLGAGLHGTGAQPVSTAPAATPESPWGSGW